MALDPIVAREKSRIDRQARRSNRNQERVFYSQSELQLQMQQLLATPSRGKALGNWYSDAAQKHPYAALAAAGIGATILATQSDDTDEGYANESWLPDLLPSAEAGINRVSKDAVTQKDLENVTKGIATELSNHPAWMKKLIKQKYDGSDQRPISVNLEKPEVRAIFKRMGKTGHHGMYNPEDDTLIIPASNDEELQRNGLDAVDHEIFHALWDHFKFAEKDRHPNFKGPSYEEIQKYIKARSESEAFAPVRDNLAKSGLLLDINAQYSILENQYFPMHKAMFNKLKRISDMVKSNRKVLDKLPNNEGKELLKEYDVLCQRFNGYNAKVVSFADTFQKSFGNLGNDSDEPNVPIETLEQITNTLKGFPEKFEGYESMAADLKTLKKKVRARIAYQREIEYVQDVKEIQEKIKTSKNGKEIEQLKSYLALIENTRQIKKSMDRSGMEDLMDSLSRMNGYIRQFSATRTDFDNRRSLRDTLYNPNEFMAREADSLLGVYFGESNQNKFELTRESLEFWKKFSVQSNVLGFKRMLNDAIQKYEVGMYMKDHGATPEEIQKELEFSNGGWYRYNGASGLTGTRYFNWKGPNIKFDTKLPFYTGHDKLLEATKGLRDSKSSK